MTPAKKGAAALAALSLSLILVSGWVLAFPTSPTDSEAANNLLATKVGASATVADGAAAADSASAGGDGAADSAGSPTGEVTDSDMGEPRGEGADLPAPQAAGGAGANAAPSSSGSSAASESSGAFSQDRPPASRDTSASSQNPDSPSVPSAGTPSGEAAPAAPQAPAAEAHPALVVTVSIDSSSVGSPVSAATSPTLGENATALDALRACGLDVDVVESQFGAYVRAIGGLAEKEHGPSSGWTYAVNGQRPATACSNYQLSDNDHVQWIYVAG